MPATVEIHCEAASEPLVDKAVQLLRTRIAERCGDGVIMPGNSAARVTLALVPGIGIEGFRIESDASSPGGVRIVGNDGRGLIYGVGKFLRTSRLEPGRFVPSDWRGASVPKRPVRGIYFATHFHNFYHDAPIGKVQRYVEDLALWGCNALQVWFDMHHFRGINDPAAQAMIARLKAILRTANGVGIDASLGGLANEAYADSPSHLRAPPARWSYHVEICPSLPEGLEQIVQWRREMLEAFADIAVKYFWLWPYDQGGCACAKCRPWGSNGYLRNGEAVARIVRKMLPKAKVVLSTWCFGYWDADEWPGLAKAFEVRPDWVDFIMADSHSEFPKWPLEHGVPGGFPMLNFPEISMFNNGPWGGYGAVPAPDRFQKIWDTVGSRLAGGFPYSEGIYEDMNKAINLQHYWGDRPALETIREYAAGEFSPDVADEVVEVVRRLEASQHHALTDITKDRGNWPAKLTAPLYHLPKAEPAASRETADRLLAAERRLPAVVVNGWRWRVLRCRALLDAELSASAGVPTEVSEACFNELSRIYHAADAEGAVKPPS
ncbi:MAG: hypothetical protein NTW19_01065, partial [Planctomycetota bacterium]|nr:hypothetical protein [Planctomycetota bacterium]